MRLWPLLFVVMAVGCTSSLHVLHVSDFDPTYRAFNRGEWVEAETEQFTVMGFVGQTDYVNQAYTKLQGECPGGTVQGIQTEYSTEHGFFSWTNKIRMQGLCIKN